MATFWIFCRFSSNFHILRHQFFAIFSCYVLKIFLVWPRSTVTDRYTCPYGWVLWFSIPKSDEACCSWYHYFCGILFCRWPGTFKNSCWHSTPSRTRWKTCDISNIWQRSRYVRQGSRHDRAIGGGLSGYQYGMPCQESSQKWSWIIPHDQSWHSISHCRRDE